ncbi:hypothetical protein GS399_00130 [Pedobacter sp. HMF7647]|uniref:Uncharacterized protein n=1 Tax=Hufsiella arboris TaxID=2695275 RepID=A0A7K1Y4L6_9SPHI|nr:hypothetical protein [Hufsiella arboris]MXV49360.1 hypothetical protein [Hufsiella arboris]
MNLNKSIAYFLVYTGILVCLTVLVSKLVQPAQILIPGFWIIFLSVAILTFISYMLALSGIKKGGEMSINMIMAAIGMKLIFCLALVVVYLLKFKVNGLLFAADFFSVYLLFTAFEVYTLLRNLRHQNKT